MTEQPEVMYEGHAGLQPPDPEPHRPQVPDEILDWFGTMPAAALEWLHARENNAFDLGWCRCLDEAVKAAREAGAGIGVLNALNGLSSRELIAAFAAKELERDQ